MIRTFSIGPIIIREMTGFTRSLQPVSVTLPEFGITAFISRHGRLFRMSRTSNSFHKLVLVIEGEGVLEAGQRTVALKANTVVRTIPHQMHRFVDEPSTPMTLAVLCVSSVAAGAALRQVWSQVIRNIPLGRVAAVAPGYAAEVYSLNREIAVEASAGLPHARLMITSLAVETIVQLLRGLRGSHPTSGAPRGTAFAGTLLWLDRHFTQATSISELADRAGMSYRSFTNHFAEQTGSTVTKYITRKRMELALNLIKSGGDILQAAFEAGFSDISHFYRMCRRFTGTTPGSFSSKITILNARPPSVSRNA